MYIFVLANVSSAVKFIFQSLKLNMFDLQIVQYQFSCKKQRDARVEE